MSGVTKSIGKIFKRVVKNPLNILPIAAAGAAIFFTGGAALGLTPTFGAAMTQLATSVGATGTLGSVLAGSLTGAGYGSLLGGGLSALTGGDIMTGMQYGTIGGAATGGLLRGVGPAPAGADVLSGSAGADTLAAGGGPALSGPSAGPTGASIAGQTGGGLSGGAAGGAAASGAAAAATPAATPFAAGGWLERNQLLVGPSIAGVGGGLLRYAEAGDDAKAQVEVERERQKYRRGSYEGQIPGYRELSRGSAGRYVYDPDRGSIVYKTGEELAREEP